jgi:hypothetical protein
LKSKDIVIVMGHRGDLPRLVQKYVANPRTRYRAAQADSPQLPPPE